MTGARPHGWTASPHADDGGGRPAAVLWKRFAAPRLACSTAIVGGGLLRLDWVVNATVAAEYWHADPVAHACSIAHQLGLAGSGACLLTAVDVSTGGKWFAEDGVVAMTTAGTSGMGWAAAPSGEATAAATASGTINIVVEVPEPMAKAALVNLVVTITEAKAQYLLEAGHRATGTPTDAVVVAAPSGEPGEDGRYGGPRSRWGSVAARTVLGALRAREYDLGQ